MHGNIWQTVGVESSAGRDVGDTGEEGAAAMQDDDLTGFVGEMGAVAGDGVDDEGVTDTATGSEVEQPGQEEETATGEVEAEPAAEDLPTPDPDDPAEKTPEQQAGLRKALLAERRKRQEREKELERKNAELEGQVRVYQTNAQRPAQPTEPPPDKDDLFFSVGPGQYVDDRANEAVKQAKFDIYRENMCEKFPDYEQAEAEFLREAREKAQQGDYSLQNALAASSNAPRFAYNYVKREKILQEAGSLEELEAKIETRVRAKIEAEQRAGSGLAAAKKATRTSAGATSSGARAPAEPATEDEAFNVNTMLKGVGNDMGLG
jgi:hypothetical protein